MSCLIGKLYLNDSTGFTASRSSVLSRQESRWPRLWRSVLGRDELGLFHLGSILSCFLGWSRPDRSAVGGLLICCSGRMFSDSLNDRRYTLRDDDWARPAWRLPQWAWRRFGSWSRQINIKWDRAIRFQRQCVWICLDRLSLCPVPFHSANYGYNRPTIRSVALVVFFCSFRIQNRLPSQNTFSFVRCAQIWNPASPIPCRSHTDLLETFLLYHSWGSGSCWTEDWNRCRVSYWLSWHPVINPSWVPSDNDYYAHSLNYGCDYSWRWCSIDSVCQLHRCFKQNGILE